MQRFPFIDSLAPKFLLDKAWVTKNLNKFRKLLIDYMTSIDPRQASKVKYPSYEIVFLLIYSIFIGCRDIESIVDLLRDGSPHIAELRKMFRYKNLNMSRKPIDQLLQRIDSKQFAAFIFLLRKEILNHIGEKINSKIGMPRYSIDGKYVNGSHKGTPKRTGYNIVNIYDTDNQVFLGSMVVDDKKNERSAARALIPKLADRYALFTGDALYTEKSIIRLIVENGCEYVLPVKHNNKASHADIESFFRYANDNPSDVGIDEHVIDWHREKDYMVKKVVLSTTEKGWFDYLPFDNVATIGMMTTYRRYVGQKNKNEKESVQIRYFVSSLCLTSEQLWDIVLEHWQIEEAHSRMDRHYYEDARHLSNKNAVKIMNELIKLVDYVVLVASSVIEKKKDRRSVSDILRYLKRHVQSFVDVFALCIST